jgi:tagaturonate reductase
MLQKLNRTTAKAPQNRPIKVLQFGEGNFLRAFVDWMIDIMNERTEFNGAVQIIQPIAHGMGTLVNEQEGLYHVVLNGIKNQQPVSETRLITCVAGVINPYEQYQAFLKTAENPNLEFIISNTTEAGISFDAKDTSADVLPSSFPGKITVLLHHRFKFFNGAPDKGLILIPCELIDKNGTMLKQMVLKYADHWKLSTAFKEWINQNSIFCNTLVDRIVPGFPKENIAALQQQLGYEDNLVVTAEPFHLWVIEGPDSVRKKFPADQAGLDVKFVADQTPYRTRKVRILNGAHTAMVPVAYLRGLRTVMESVEDDYMRSFLQQVIYEEIIPTLDLPREELVEFADAVIERFQNPFIRHELISIALNSVSKFKVRVLPSLVEYTEINHKLPEKLVQALAALILFYKGTYNGTAIPLADTQEVLDFMNDAWKENDLKVAVTKILAHQAFWDVDLTLMNGLTERVIAAAVLLQITISGEAQNS